MSSPFLDVDALLDDPAIRILVCCGSGGVGKTTTSAALALRAADRGRRVAVLTIDPARRLAQALGLAELGNEPGRVAGVPEETTTRRTPPTLRAGGELHAMMLDMRRTFDEMVQAHSTPDRAEKILANPFYQTISTSFSGTQEYMAMEKLGQLAATGKWDLIRRGHPTVALRTRLPRRPAAHVDLPRRPDDPPPLLTGPSGRAQPA
jgi:anion-transporting  ArsA/GET3 family ATPase